MRIAKTNQYWWPVEFEIQEEDYVPGSSANLTGTVPVVGLSKSSCELLFKRARGHEVEQVFKDAGGNDVNICRAVVVKWRDFLDVDGLAVEWSHESFEEAISYPPVAAEIVRAWARSLSAVARKN